ncbi:hypothetical protein D3C76_1584410 [compost metagenome]
MLVPAQADGFLERPGAIRVKGDACVAKAFSQGGDRFDFFIAAQYATLELEVVEAVFGLCGFSQAHDRFGAHGFLVA